MKNFSYLVIKINSIEHGYEIQKTIFSLFDFKWVSNDKEIIKINSTYVYICFNNKQNDKTGYLYTGFELGKHDYIIKIDELKNYLYLFEGNKMGLL